MLFNEKYKGIFITEKQLKDKLGGNFEIENNYIKNVDIVVIAHFGNVVAIRMDCENICPLPLYNSTHNVGYIIRALIEMFDKEKEDGVSINALNNTPIRIVLVKGRCVAIGHYMKDRFIFTEDLMKIKE